MVQGEVGRGKLCVCCPLPLLHTPSAAKEYIELLLSLGANRSEATKAVVKKVGGGSMLWPQALVVLGMMMLLLAPAST